jgi:hypothetical protein
VFTLGAPYNKELLMQFGRFLPAIFGALISVAMPAQQIKRYERCLIDGYNGG